MYIIDSLDSLKKHISWKADEDVKAICKPFFEKFSINYFDYAVTYDRDTHYTSAVLVSDRDWYEHHFKKRFIISSTMYDSGIHLWSSEGNEERIRDGRNLFNHDYGISFFKKYKNYWELVDFATFSGNHRIMDFYFNHVDILEIFVMYFKEKAQDLIKQALAQQIMIPKDMTGVISVDTIGINKKNILESIKPKKYILDIVNYSKKYLTPKEFEVLKFFCKGYSMKEIARFLNISARTAEDHINNVKRKLGIIRKFELIDFIATLNSHLL